MTKQDIEDSLANIRKSSYSDETAHIMEDELYMRFVKHVADTAGGELAECAKLVLTTENIDFARWHA